MSTAILVPFNRDTFFFPHKTIPTQSFAHKVTSPQQQGKVEKQKICYNKEQLLALRNAPSSKVPPPNVPVEIALNH